MFWFSDPSSLYYKSTRNALSLIVKREGFRGLYKGVLPQLMSIGPTSAIQFACYNTFTELYFYFKNDQLNLGNSTLNLKITCIKFQLNLFLYFRSWKIFKWVIIRWDGKNNHVPIGYHSEKIANSRFWRGQKKFGSHSQVFEYEALHQNHVSSRKWFKVILQRLCSRNG